MYRLVEKNEIYIELAFNRYHVYNFFKATKSHRTQTRTKTFIQKGSKLYKVHNNIKMHID